jgi:hypothetical protein
MKKRCFQKSRTGFFLSDLKEKSCSMKYKRIPPSVVLISGADPDAGSGAFLTPGSGIRNRFFSGSRISNPGSKDHIFKSFLIIFLGKVL